MNLQQTIDLQAAAKVKAPPKKEEKPIQPLAPSKIAAKFGYKHKNDIRHDQLQLQVHKDSQGNTLTVHTGSGKWEHTDNAGSFVKNGQGGESLHQHLMVYHPRAKASK